MTIEKIRMRCEMEALLAERVVYESSINVLTHLMQQEGLSPEAISNYADSIRTGQKSLLDIAERLRRV